MLTEHLPVEYVRPLKILTGRHTALTHLALFTGRRHVFVKAYPETAPRGLLNEIIGYLMAEHSGIQQPPGGIIQLSAEMLAAVDISTPSPSVWCFASTSCINLDDRRQGSLTALFGDNLRAMRPLLEAWPGFPLLIAFDTWLANVDRNTGNLMMTGANMLTPIDSSDILTGSYWRLDDLVAAEQNWTVNKLVDCIWPTNELPLPIRSAVLQSARRFQGAYAMAREDLYRWLHNGHADTHRGHHFIWARSETAPTMLAARMQMIL